MLNDGEQVRFPVLHVGPDPSRTGGMETVIRAYRDGKWKRLDISVEASTGNPIFMSRVGLFSNAVRAIRMSPHASILHLHMSHYGSFIREGALARIAGNQRVVVATVHGSSFVDSSKRWYWRAIYRWALHPMAAIGTLNNEALDTARRLTHVPVSILPNPGPILEGGGDQIEQREPVVVFAGQVGERKGVDTLLLAWETVIAKAPSARLVILGPLDPAFRRIWSEKLKPHYVGEASPETVQSHLRTATCAVLPSRAEGQPMFLIEALGLGTPIVVTPAGGMPGLAEDCGFIVEQDSPAALAEALIRLLSDKETNDDFRSAALKKYAEKFSLKSHEEGLTELYRRAVSGADTRGRRRNS